MDRRRVLQSLALLPLVVGVEVPPLVPLDRAQLLRLEGEGRLHDLVPALGPTMKAPPGWMGMADALWNNAIRYIAGHEVKHGTLWDREELRHMHAICYRMCNYLMNNVEQTEEMARQYHPEVPAGFLSNMRWVVTSAPVAGAEHPKTKKMQTAPCHARRMKLRYNKDLLEDLSAFCGIDIECELVATLGQEAAFEVAMELCQHIKNGNRVHTYAFYLPPLMEPVDKKLTDFSANRGFRMRYAKFV